MLPADQLFLHVGKDHGSVLVRPVGVLDVASYPDLQDALIECAAEAPPAIIVDIDDLAVPSALALSVFATVWMQINEWPGVELVLVAADPARRATLGRHPVARYVPIYRDLGAAASALSDPPLRRRGQLALPAAAASSALARMFVKRRCETWGLAALADDAAAIATELVENVLKHTRSRPVLRVEARGRTLTIAVSDGDPRCAVLREAVSDIAPSAGLAIVTKVARTWGCTPTRDGKVVWAVLPVV